MEFCPFAFLYLKELLLAHCFLVRGTSFSFSHLPFSLSLTKAEIATWDCWCLSKEGCCSHAVEQHQGFGQSEHKNLIVFFGNRFLFKSSPKQVHASWYIPQHSSPAPLLHFLPPSFQHRLSFYHLLHPLLLWKTSIHKSILLQGELCVSSMSKNPGTVVQVFQCAFICPIHH